LEVESIWGVIPVLIGWLIGLLIFGLIAWLSRPVSNVALIFALKGHEFCF
jgi:hypothetical protein